MYGNEKTSPRLRDTISENLRKRIFDGTLAPGTRLIERNLADEYGVSRFPVREAVRMLTQEGLVQSLPTRGSVVRTLDLQEVKSIFRIRESLEPVAAQLAAENVSKGYTNTLFQYVDESMCALKKGEQEEAKNANSTFHDALIDLADDAILKDTLTPLVARLHWIFRQVPDLEKVSSGHRELAEAIGEGNPRLAKVEALKHVIVNETLTLNYLSGLPAWN